MCSNYEIITPSHFQSASGSETETDELAEEQP